MRKTPYVVSAGSSGAKSIEGSTGYWGKFPDPFDPSFRASLERRMNGERDKSAGDPFCIGYFVDNELGWGDELSLANAALGLAPGASGETRSSWPTREEVRDDRQAERGVGHYSRVVAGAARTPHAARCEAGA